MSKSCASSPPWRLFGGSGAALFIYFLLCILRDWITVRSVPYFTRNSCHHGSVVAGTRLQSGKVGPVLIMRMMIILNVLKVNRLIKILKGRTDTNVVPKIIFLCKIM
jgi:hypothetical protein